jgi:hypothetical protein
MSLTMYPLPVEQGGAFGGLIFWILVFFLAIILRVVVLVLVYRDANSRGMDATPWVLCVVLIGFLGFIIYIIVRRRRVWYVFPDHHRMRLVTPSDHPRTTSKRAMERQRQYSPYEKVYYDDVVYEDYYEFED